MVENNAGIYLDGQFDFSIDSTGDIQAVYGSDELQKDLAFQMVLGLSQYLGTAPSGNLNAKVAGTAEAIATGDSRINSVVPNSFDVEFNSKRSSIDIEMRVITEIGERRLVFDV